MEPRTEWCFDSFILVGTMDPDTAVAQTGLPGWMASHVPTQAGPGPTAEFLVGVSQVIT